MITLLDNPVPFGGGIQLPANKSMSLERPLREAVLPAQLVIPLRQHIGIPARSVVKPGDFVQKGQVVAQSQGYISAPVHASPSGKVIDINEYPVPSPSGATSPCIVIETDGEDRWLDQGEPVDDFYKLSPVEVQRRIFDAGIVGLGGAGFPSAMKLIPGLNLDIELLILNAAECEPYISCDETLVRHHVREIIAGIEILAHALQVDECVIAIEDNKNEAIEILEQGLAEHASFKIRLMKVSSLYPAGGEKQLIKSITGLEIPSDGLPVDIGVVCYNVGTAYAAQRAIQENRPLLNRIVTVTGAAVEQPCNLEVLLGTPINEIIDQCGGYTDDFDYLVMGGPMMGFRLHSDRVPVIKTTNCLLVVAMDEHQQEFSEMACIRCDECARVCPVNLQPQQLHWHSREFNSQRLVDYHLFDCTECGCCSYVCPSHIPLVENYRGAKSRIWSDRRRQLEAKHNRQRFLDKEARLLHEKEAKQESRNSANEQDVSAVSPGQDDKKQAIADAVQRVREKRKQRDSE